MVFADSGFQRLGFEALRFIGLQALRSPELEQFVRK